MKLDLTEEETRRLQALADAAPDPTMRGVPKAARVRVMALRVFAAGLDIVEARQEGTA